MTSELIFWVMVCLAFVLAFVIGANDAANALGTSYGSNATKLIYLLLLGATFELLGSVFLSSKLAGTLVYKVIPVMSN
jgi:phosphate/sulfate permease